MTTTITLTNGMTATVRTGKAGDSGISWSEPFSAELIIEKDRKGVVGGLSLKGINFAEFDPRYHSEADNVYLAEDYALEILSDSECNKENPSQSVKTITLPEHYWDDIIYILNEGLADMANFSPKESDGYTSDDIAKRDRIMQHHAFDALVLSLKQQNS